MGPSASKKYIIPSESQLNVPKYDLSHFGVITVIFNPIKYKSRYELYHKFDEHMSRSGVTLLTVECIFKATAENGLPRQKFEITRSNDPRHLQIEAPSVLWLKENLINIAVKRLPAYVEYVAWLDADIEFQRLDWPHLAIHQLQQYTFVQLFELASFLGPSGKKQILRQDYSFAYAIRHQHRLDAQRSSECFVHPGYAWAMRRATFELMGGLLDFSILGSGDIHFAYALINRIDETIPNDMHEDYRRLVKVWGQRVAQLSNDGASVGYVPTHIWHHWHGSRVNRGYFDRWIILQRFQFSPLKDLEKNNKLGLIRLADTDNVEQTQEKRRIRSLQEDIISYFRSRNEDNLKKPVPAINLTMANIRSRISSNDTVRPSNLTTTNYPAPWTTNIRQPQGDERFPQTVNDPYSISRTYNQRLTSPHVMDDLYYRTYARGHRYRIYDSDYMPRQNILYEDEFGNLCATLPEEISF